MIADMRRLTLTSMTLRAPLWGRPLPLAHPTRPASGHPTSPDRAS